MAVEKVVIPVQFFDAADSYKKVVAQLEAELKKVKPGTAIYDSIVEQLKKARKLSSKIDIDLGENISKKSDISRLEKDFANLYSVIEDINKSYKNLDFNNLNINTQNFGQLAEDYKNIRIELEKAQQAAKEAKSISIDKLFAGDANALKQFDKNDLSKAGTELFSKLTEEAQKAETAISQAANEIDELEKKLESTKRSNSNTKQTYFSKKIIDITKDSKATVTERRENLNAQLQSYFKKNGEWKANANSSQAEQIMRTFGMDQETINKVLTTIPDRAKIIQEAVNNVSQEAFKTAHSEHYSVAAEAKKKVENITSKIAKNKNIQVDKQAELNSINQALEILREKLINIGALSADGTSLSRLDQEIYTLEKQVRDLQEALLKQAPNIEDPNSPPSTLPLAQGYDDTLQAELFKNNLQNAIKQWFGVREIINLVKRGIHQAYQDIQGLDKAMTNIAVVTNMSVGDLWGKINEYMAVAKQYGVTTQGVYEVSQLYYQQGLNQKQVTELTTETLKLARVANMDYAASADAMTVALRGFNMEMSQAATVTDVYSKVAAITASDQAELATAMSKTASSAASVGSSFENTTAMLAVMIETTRESSQNLGSALKSIK